MQFDQFSAVVVHFFLTSRSFSAVSLLIQTSLYRFVLRYIDFIDINALHVNSHAHLPSASWLCRWNICDWLLFWDFQRLKMCKKFMTFLFHKERKCHENICYVCVPRNSRKIMHSCCSCTMLCHLGTLSICLRRFKYENSSGWSPLPSRKSIDRRCIFYTNRVEG